MVRSVGNGKYGVLMEIPDVYYEEDAKAKQERVDETERGLTRTAEEELAEILIKARLAAFKE